MDAELGALLLVLISHYRQIVNAIVTKFKTIIGRLELNLKSSQFVLMNIIQFYLAGLVSMKVLR